MIPEEALAGFEEVKARAVGLGDIGEKEAIIWTIFSYLLQTADAAKSWQLLLGAEAPWPSALIFGGEALGEQAEVVREQLLERGQWVPEVVLEQWPGGLCFVLARHLKPHREVNDAAAWRPILHETDAFLDAASARASGRIDLARAWRLGWDLAGRRPFTLVDLRLLPERATQKAATDLLISSLALRDDRRFLQLRWRDLIETVPLPEWLLRFVAAHRLR